MFEENTNSILNGQEDVVKEAPEKKEEPKINVEDVKEKVAEVKEKMSEAKEKIKEKLEDTPNEQNKIKPLVTSRILFISVLDKILIVCLLLSFISATYFNFAGTLSSPSYAFWHRVAGEIGIIFITFISYLFVNWLYKCAAKTMLCLTNNEVYQEIYIPFVRIENSVPLNKITKVTTFNYFWIFRTIIIHQYGKLPIVFCTWNNQEFKDKLNELITTDKGQVENEYQNRNLISNMKFVKYVGLALLAVIILVGLARAIALMTSPAKSIPGTYVYSHKAFELKSNGLCDIDSLKDDVTECDWEYYDETNNIIVNYKYQYYSYYYGYSTRSDYFYMTYDKDNKTITYNGDIYTKQK